MYAFSGEGPAGVQVQVVKTFSDRGGAPVQRRIERLEPDRYTRVGAAVRHTTARLATESAERRLLLLLTDGRPNDVDQYEGRYGVEDTRQAVREAACEGVLVFASPWTVPHGLISPPCSGLGERRCSTLLSGCPVRWWRCCGG